MYREAKPITSMLILFLSAIAFLAHAYNTETVEIYTSQLAVESRSPNERNIASSEALKNVYIKATGDTDVIQRYPSLSKYLNSAPRYIVGYQYQERPAFSEVDLTAKTLQLELKFDEAAIRQQLKQVGAPFWSKQRPQALVILLEKSEEGIDLLSVSNNSPLVQAIIDYSFLRGVPVSFASAPLKADAAWRATPDEVILQMAKKENANIILFGKFGHASNQKYIGQWYSIDLSKDTLIRTNHFESEDLNRLVSAGFSPIVADLAEQYAIYSNQQQGYSVSQQIIVKNVKSARDYNELVSYFRQLSAFQTVHLQSVSQDTVSFTAQVSGDVDKVAQLIALNKRLSIDSIASDLTFYWQ